MARKNKTIKEPPRLPDEPVTISDSEYETDSDDPDDGRTYAIDRILRKQMRKGQPYYKIRWAGFSEAHDTWEPASNILDKVLLEQFETNYKKMAPGSKSSTRK
jgi:hypothetical protein